jgi:hypothetical protein
MLRPYRLRRPQSPPIPGWPRITISVPADTDV